MIRPLIHRLSFSIALTLSAASLVAFAVEPQDSTEVEVTVNGNTEKLTLVDLKVGETRQIYSEAGNLVTATRTAESLELDIGGDKTSIKMIDASELGASELGDAELTALIEAHTGDAAAGEKRVVRIHREHAVDGKAGGHTDGHRKVIVISGDAGAGHEPHTDDAHVVMKHDGAAGGKQVIVRRKVTKPADTEAK